MNGFLGVDNEDTWERVAALYTSHEGLGSVYCHKYAMGQRWTK